MVGTEAEAKHLDTASLHVLMYQLAFVQGDSGAMSKQKAWAQEKQNEASLLFTEVATEAYEGKIHSARGLSRQAVESLSRDDFSSLGFAFADSGRREALLGNLSLAKTPASRPLTLKTDSRVRFLSALTTAQSQDSTLGQALAEELNKDFPDDTLVQSVFIPEIRAQLAMDHNDPSHAIELLNSVIPYQMGHDSLRSVYLRGQAYLAGHKGRAAAAEFERILDHREIVQNSLIGALAHLGLGRAYAMQGNTTKAKAAYQDFLTLWKDADSDIPILKQAKAEYANLK